MEEEESGMNVNHRKLLVFSGRANRDGKVEQIEGNDKKRTRVRASIVG